MEVRLEKRNEYLPVRCNNLVDTTLRLRDVDTNWVIEETYLKDVLEYRLGEDHDKEHNGNLPRATVKIKERGMRLAGHSHQQPIAYYFVSQVMEWGLADTVRNDTGEIGGLMAYNEDIASILGLWRLRKSVT